MKVICGNAGDFFYAFAFKEVYLLRHKLSVYGELSTESFNIVVGGGRPTSGKINV